MGPRERLTEITQGGVAMDELGKFKHIYTEDERHKKTKAEYSRLKKTFNDLPAEKKRLCEKLLNNAAFSAVLLDEAREIISRDGMIEAYQNGAAQFGLKKSSAVDIYDKSLNTYSKVIKQLCDMLPEGAAVDPAEEILRFVASG